LIRGEKDSYLIPSNENLQEKIKTLKANEKYISVLKEKNMFFEK